MGDTIRVPADKPCLLAHRLVQRLLREDLLIAGRSPREFLNRIKRVTDTLADEIHQDILDGTLRKGS